MPLRRRPDVITIINIVDALPALILGIWFLFFGNNWFTIAMIMVAVHYSAFILGIFCPESPRWLLLNDRKAEAIEEINYMARFNGSSKRIPEDA